MAFTRGIPLDTVGCINTWDGAREGSPEIPAKSKPKQPIILWNDTQKTPFWVSPTGVPSLTRKEFCKKMFYGHKGNGIGLHVHLISRIDDAPWGSFSRGMPCDNGTPDTFLLVTNQPFVFLSRSRNYVLCLAVVVNNPFSAVVAKKSFVKTCWTWKELVISCIAQQDKNNLWKAFSSCSLLAQCPKSLWNPVEKPKNWNESSKHHKNWAATALVTILLDCDCLIPQTPERACPSHRGLSLWIRILPTGISTAPLLEPWTLR